MTERYTIFSEAGDEYRLQFTTDRSNIIADRIFAQKDAVAALEEKMKQAYEERTGLKANYVVTL